MGSSAEMAGASKKSYAVDLAKRCSKSAPNANLGTGNATMSRVSESASVKRVGFVSMRNASKNSIADQGSI